MLRIGQEAKAAYPASSAVSLLNKLGNKVRKAKRQNT